MKNTKQVNFYFDFTSPYSYLAWEKILRDQSLDLHPIPVMVGKVIAEVGSVGPGEIKPKREYLFKDCLRRALKLDIPLRAPQILPFNPLGALRFVLACSDDKEKQKRVITAFFRYGWREGGNFEDYESLKKYIVEEAGISEQEYDTLDSDRLARKAIKQNIKDAVENGVFGVPSFEVENEIFWGLDSIEFVRGKLNEDHNEAEKKIEMEFNRFVKILEGEKNV